MFYGVVEREGFSELILELLFFLTFGGPVALARLAFLRQRRRASAAAACKRVVVFRGCRVPAAAVSSAVLRELCI